jgi:predicted PurR-regulated permease PerM
MKIFEELAPITLVIAGTVLVGLLLVLISWAAPVLTPVMMAGYLAALFAPLYTWLQRRGVNKRTALILLVVVLVAGGLLLAGLLVLSVNRLTEGIITYQSQLGDQESRLRDTLTAMGLEEGDLRSMISGDALTTVLVAILGFVVDFAGDLLFSLVLIAFFLLESNRFLRLAETRLRDRPVFSTLPEMAKTAVVYFGVRTRLNLLTGVGITVILLILGVDYALLWGLIAFILSYVPYIGLFTAAVPPTILALAEHGLSRAVIVVAGVIIINLAIENIFEPRLTGKTLKLSPTVVILSFFFWAWLLGPTGALLSMPITVMILLIMDSDEQTRWVARLIGTARESEISTKQEQE